MRRKRVNRRASCSTVPLSSGCLKNPRRTRVHVEIPRPPVSGQGPPWFRTETKSRVTLTRGAWPASAGRVSGLYEGMGGPHHSWCQAWLRSCGHLTWTSWYAEEAGRCEALLGSPVLKSRLQNRTCTATMCPQ